MIVYYDRLTVMMPASVPELPLRERYAMMYTGTVNMIHSHYRDMMNSRGANEGDIQGPYRHVWNWRFYNADRELKRRRFLRRLEI